MRTVRLGRTDIFVNKNGFGALPIQRATENDAIRILRRAYEGGFNYFDTARFYTNSEQRIGAALGDVRDKIIISSKTMRTEVEGFWRELHTSLELLKTDYIDIYQFHNPPFCPKPGDGSGLYEAMLEAKDKGLIRHIGISSHKITIAKEAVTSGLYETLQYPLSYLASDEELALVELCREYDVGFICMKALAGGLITRADAAYAFLRELPVAPIWGIQRDRELDDFLSFMENEPELTDEIKEYIERDRAELIGEFCRGCGYCMPCPQGIKINDCARMSLLLRRAPLDAQLTEANREMMKKIENCTGCGACAKKCPYGLDTPVLLRKNYEDYKTFI